MDEVWCGLDLQLPANDDGVAGLHGAADDAPFWPSLADFLAGDIDTITAGSAADSSKVAEDMVLDVDHQATCFVPPDGEQRDLLLMMPRSEQTYDSSSYSSLSSSKRSLSIDSAGTTSSPAFSSFGLDAGATFSSSAADPFAGDDDAAIMRAMMAVLSSASPSSSESSSPQRYCCHESGGSTQQAAAVYPRGGNDVGNGHVMVRSTSLAAVAPEKNAAALLTNNSAGGGQQEEDAARAAAATGNSSQVYHMMSERKRREKLNDSFQTLRSLLPPCSKGDDLEE